MSAVHPLPSLSVEIDGLPPELADTLLTVSVRARLSDPTQCELSWSIPPGARAEPGGGHPRTPGPRPGAPMVVALDRTILFEGRVTAVEHLLAPDQQRTLRIRGYDALHALRDRPSLRVDTDRTLAWLVAERVAALGLSVEAPDPGPRWPRVGPRGPNDLDVLAELGERCGLYLTLRGRVLHLLPLAGREEPGGPIRLGAGEELLEARVTLNEAAGASSVTVHAWDPGRATPTTGEAKAGATGQESGPARLLTDAPSPSAATAAALARAELDRAAQDARQIWGVAEGDLRLRPGARVEVTGLGALSGPFALTGVHHRIDATVGFVTELWSAPPPRRARPAGPVATLGTVSRVDDPEGLGRVRAKLAGSGDAETDWLQVAAPGAGAGKGWVFLPDVGDRVLVISPRGDPAEGVIVGSLYGPGAPHDAGVEGGAVRRSTWRTVGGHRVQLDDAGALRVEAADGSALVLGPDGVRLHARSPLVLEAPGQPVRIRGASIDLERA